MTKNKFKQLRVAMGYTQAQLSIETNLSIRTIQRVESGHTIPKGYTLDKLAQALGFDKTEIGKKNQEADIANQKATEKLKIINLASLSFLGIPFGNIIVPYLIWKKHKTNPVILDVGKKIISIQIIWSVILCISLIVSPFLQDYFFLNFSLILGVCLVAFLVNLYLIFRTSKSLNKQDYTFLSTHWQLL